MTQRLDENGVPTVAGQNTEPDPQEQRATASPRRSLSARFAVALLVIGALVAGTALGWVLHARYAPQPTPVIAGGDIIVPPLPSAVAPTSRAPAIPDVRGLSQEDAQQAIADSGTGVSSLIIAKRPHVGPEGFVVAQNPIGGSAPAAKMTLVLPVPASTPNLVGRSQADAKAILESLGAAVSQEHTYRAGSPAGTVIASRPAAGAVLTEDAVLVIADPPAARYLADLSANGPFSTNSSASISGTKYSKGLSCPARRVADSQDTVWLINRKVGTLTGTIGLDDQSVPGVDAVIRVSGDGRTIFTARLTYGTAQKISIDTSGVLRLTITALLVDDLAENQPTVDLGDVLMNGAEADLAGLVGQ